MSRADLERFGEQLDYEIFPVLVQLVTQTPPQPGPLPAPVEPPALSEGPHLGYAVQWFIFAVIAMVGYPLILRRVARTRANRSDGPEAAATVPT